MVEEDEEEQGGLASEGISGYLESTQPRFEGVDTR